jgi:hypothetical protein
MLLLKMYAFTYDSMNMGCVEHRNGKVDPSAVLLHYKHYCSLLECGTGCRVFVLMTFRISK